jgi:hypothetical protein
MSRKGASTYALEACAVGLTTTSSISTSAERHYADTSKINSSSTGTPTFQGFREIRPTDFTNIMRLANP